MRYTLVLILASLAMGVLFDWHKHAVYGQYGQEDELNCPRLQGGYDTGWWLWEGMFWRPVFPWEFKKFSLADAPFPPQAAPGPYHDWAPMKTQADQWKPIIEDLERTCAKCAAHDKTHKHRITIID